MDFRTNKLIPARIQKYKDQIQTQTIYLGQNKLLLQGDSSTKTKIIDDYINNIQNELGTHFQVDIMDLDEEPYTLDDIMQGLKDTICPFS